MTLGPRLGLAALARATPHPTASPARACVPCALLSAVSPRGQHRGGGLGGDDRTDVARRPHRGLAAAVGRRLANAQDRAEVAVGDRVGLALAVPRGTQTLVQRIISVVSATTAGPLQVPGVMVTVSPTRPGLLEITGSVLQRGPASVATAGLGGARGGGAVDVRGGADRDERVADVGGEERVLRRRWRRRSARSRRRRSAPRRGCRWCRACRPRRTRPRSASRPAGSTGLWMTGPLRVDRRRGGDRRRSRRPSRRPSPTALAAVTTTVTAKPTSALVSR